ncbi:MAG TPA: type II toxin-antitoxin system RelE/ParE family toxin [Kaistia sp.]|nr:type II toxin-antitoxin system RelE/ParE family toxin [Kaistia sp.]
MRQPYRTTLEADEDIISLYVEGVRQFGVIQAEAYLQRLIACFDLLAEQPALGRRYRGLRAPVRLHFHGSHVVAYSDTDDGLVIIRVLHGRSNWERHLDPEG